MLAQFAGAMILCRRYMARQRITLAMIGSTLVSYTRAKGDALGIDASVGYMQRHERAVWLGVSTAVAPIVSAFVEPGSPQPLYHLVVIVMALMAVLTNITAFWRISVVMNGIKLRQANRPPHE